MPNISGAAPDFPFPWEFFAGIAGESGDLFLIYRHWANQHSKLEDIHLFKCTRAHQLRNDLSSPRNSRQCPEFFAAE